MKTDRSLILFVNDNPKSLRLLASILEDSGFEVRTAIAPWAALELIDTYSFALALLDYQIAEMSGAQLAQEIRGLDSSLPILLLSNLNSLPPGELAYVDAHVGRGTTIEELTHLMRELARQDGLAGKPSRTTTHESVRLAPGSI